MSYEKNIKIGCCKMVRVLGKGEIPTEEKQMKHFLIRHGVDNPTSEETRRADLYLRRSRMPWVHLSRGHCERCAAQSVRDARLFFGAIRRTR